VEWETNFSFYYYEIIKLVVHFALCTSKAFGPFFFKLTVAGDNYVKMLDKEAFSSILNLLLLLDCFHFKRNK